MAVRVAALVVTYFPDERLAQRLDVLAAQVERILIVDNGSDAAAVARISDYAHRVGATMHPNGANLGIATALNIGMRSLAAEGFDWVLTMDQDSTIYPGCIAALCSKIADDVALIGSMRSDAGDPRPRRWLRPKRGLPAFERVSIDRVDGTGVTLVITSGTLTSVRAFGELGRFRDDFFIDQVDNEYCLRARCAGYRVLVAPEARIAHRLGAKSVKQVAGLTLAHTNHSPLRRYYLFRNTVVIARMYAKAQPHWFVYQMLALCEIVAGIVLIERQKLSKLRACAVGIWDGVHGRLGESNRQLGP